MFSKKIVVLASVMAVTFGLSACSPTVKEPLTLEQSRFLLANLEKPTSLAKFSLDSADDFERANGDRSDVLQTFDSASPECAAVSDLEALSRFAPGENDYRKFLPSNLRGFDTMTGIRFGVATPEGAEVSSYASVRVAVLTFGSTEKALEYTSAISTNVEPCFDFLHEQGAGDNFFKRSLDLMRFIESDDGSQDFSYETVSKFEFSLRGINVATSFDQISSLHHHGPNVILIHTTRDKDANAALGITNDNLQDAIDSISMQIHEDIFEALNL